jgi:hypothetical protein
MKFIITAVAAVILFACNQNKNSNDSIPDLGRTADVTLSGKFKIDNKKFVGFYADSTPQIQSQDHKEKEDKSQEPIQTQPKIDWDKKIIKTASLNLEIKNYYSFYKSLRESVTQFGGYLAQEQQSETEYKIENTLTIKIPVDQFDNALTQVTTGVEKVNDKRITSEDVTGEVVDTKSRIEAKRQIRIRYLDLLKQAKNMEEILNVQSEINGIQEEIESASGRVNYLIHSSAYSTINLTFYEVLNATAKNNDKTSFASRMSTAFGTGWSWVGELFVGLISIWPLLFLIAGVVFFFRKNKIVKTKAA